MYSQTFLFRVALVAALTIPTPFFMTQAQADKNLWGYIHGTDTLPAALMRFTFGRPRVIKKAKAITGPGYSAGIRARLYRSLSSFFTELNGRSHQIKRRSVGRRSERKLHRGLEFDGFNVELKYNVLSVYKDLFGMSLYIEPEYQRIDKISGERVNGFRSIQLILQKNFFDDQLALLTT